jgi:hypothetical protein
VELSKFPEGTFEYQSNTSRSEKMKMNVTKTRNLPNVSIYTKGGYTTGGFHMTPRVVD